MRIAEIVTALSSLIELCESGAACPSVREARAALEELIAARAEFKARIHDVIAWMDEESKAGRLRRNSEAPAWEAYRAASVRWDSVVARSFGEPE